MISTCSGSSNYHQCYQKKKERKHKTGAARTPVQARPREIFRGEPRTDARIQEQLCLSLRMTNTSHWRASATVDATPVLSFVDGTSRFQQSFNPAWVAPSASTRWTSGLLVRSQNCSAVAGGRCVACAGSGPRNASALSFSALLSDDNHTSSAPVFAKLSDVVFAPHDAADERGTEDPRLAYDDRTGMYYMFYTAWSVSGDIRLSLATTPDPTSAPRCIYMCVLLGAALLARLTVV